MSTREITYNLIDILSEEQLKTFIDFIRSFTDIPNKETEQSMLEADRIAHDPNVKAYDDIDEMFREILDE